jgi:segregation and condensation protein B
LFEAQPFSGRLHAPTSALSAIAYQQPVTRAEPSRLVGHDISRDILGRLRSLGVIAPGPRTPMPGALVAWVTTARFLEVFALGSLRDLPDLDALDNPGARDRDDHVEAALDDALGLIEEEGAEDSELDEMQSEA